jgi:hypothetical protein
MERRRIDRGAVFAEKALLGTIHNGRAKESNMISSLARTPDVGEPEHDDIRDRSRSMAI